MINRFYALANLLILVGFAFLCQPFSMALYTAGFPVLLAGTALHIALDHIPHRDGPVADANELTGE